MMKLENPKLITRYSDSDHERAKLLEYRGFVIMSDMRDDSRAILAIYSSEHENYIKVLRADIPKHSKACGLTDDVKEYRCRNSEILIAKMRQILVISRYKSVRSNLRIFDNEIPRMKEATVEDFQMVNALI